MDYFNGIHHLIGITFDIPTPTPSPNLLGIAQDVNAIQQQSAQTYNTVLQYGALGVLGLFVFFLILVVLLGIIIVYTQRNRRQTSSDTAIAQIALSLNEQMIETRKAWSQLSDLQRKSSEDNTNKHIEAISAFSDVETRVVDTQDTQIQLLKEIQTTNKAIQSQFAMGSEPTQQILRRVNEIFELLSKVNDNLLLLRAVPNLVEFENSVKAVEEKRKTDSKKIPAIVPTPESPA